MKQKVIAVAFWAGSLALSIAAMFGYRCPAQGCPACKMMGK
jgi:hypothetical protein